MAFRTRTHYPVSSNIIAGRSRANTFVNLISTEPRFVELQSFYRQCSPYPLCSTWWGAEVDKSRKIWNKLR